MELDHTLVMPTNFEKVKPSLRKGRFSARCMAGQERKLFVAAIATKIPREEVRYQEVTSYGY
jgi:hypothetical protein